VQARLDERVIEYSVLFASCHESEPSQVGEHGSRAILAVEPRASRVPAVAAAL